MDFAHLGDVRLLTNTGRILACATEDSLVKACYSPGLVFLRNIGSYLESGSRYLKRAEEMLSHPLTPQDRQTLAALAPRREQLYSPGRITAALPQLRVDKMTVEVRGDVFSNISESVIATRGSTAKAVWQIHDKGWKELGDAITALARLLEEANQLTEQQNTDSSSLLAAIAQESGKPKPRTGILLSVSRTLLDCVRAVPPLAEAASRVLDLVRALPS